MRLSIIVVGLAFAGVGCASRSATPDTSIKGTLAIASFPSAPVAVVATSSKGTVVRASASASGAFALTLAKGERYALTVELPDRRVPVAMARKSGKLDASFKVSTAGALVQLGTVRYLAAGSKTIVTAAANGQCTNGDGECVDDSEQTACEDGQGGSASEGDNQSDGECQNGVDVKTHAACTDAPGDDAEQVDEKGELAIPEHSAPADAQGCDDGEDPND